MVSRAKMKHRQKVRRVTILAVFLVIVVSLGIGIYFAIQASNAPPTALDAYDGQAVPQSTYSSIYRLAQPPFTTSDSSTYMSKFTGINGAPYTQNGKPIVVYVGADYCEFCAVQRWSVVMSLMRFGNFTGLKYMTSSAADGDYPTFSFTGSTYQSSYIVFQPYEVQSRSGSTIAALPANYSSDLQNQGQSAYPYINFGNRYYVSGAILDPTNLAGKNWTQVISEIQSQDTFGASVKQAANAMTAAICHLTNGAPQSVCNQAPIGSLASLVSYSPSQSPVVAAAVYAMEAPGRNSNAWA